MTTGMVPTLVAAALIASAMVLTGCLSAGEARRSVEWQVLITIAAAFGVGIAMRNSKAAASIAETVVQVTRHLGPVATLACIYLMASVLTEMITNNAVAVLLFPVCLETAALLDVSPRPFIIAITLAASASLMTPIGYQTNLLVYGPGGYRFTDFMRIGLPLNLMLITVAMLLIPMFWPF
jgi:Di- and tricarboxylate transporters